ncbi:MAG: hypothetical protein ACJ0QV_01845 [Gammaproteobacteria bacterium]
MSKKIKPKIVDTLNKLYSSFEGIDSLIIEVNRTTDTSHGDLYTNVAMKLAKILKRNPMLIAEEITKNIEAMDSVEKIEIATPGYINFFLTKSNKFNELNRIMSDDLIILKENNKKKCTRRICISKPNRPTSHRSWKRYGCWRYNC